MAANDVHHLASHENLDEFLSFRNLSIRFLSELRFLKTTKNAVRFFFITLNSLCKLSIPNYTLAKRTSTATKAINGFKALKCFKTTKNRQIWNLSGFPVCTRTKHDQLANWTIKELSELSGLELLTEV